MKNKYKFWIIVLISCQLSVFSCQLLYGQFDFIGRKYTTNQPKPIPSSLLKSGNSIPSLDFEIDSIRPLNELKTGNGEGWTWLSTDGNRIYYTEEGTNQQHQKIYMAEKQPGQYKFSNLHLLPINGIDTSTNQYYSAWLTNDELNIYFIQFNDSTGTYNLKYAKRDSINQIFSTPINIKLIGAPGENNTYSMWCPSLTQDSEQLYLGYQSNIVNSICIFNKTAESEYTYSDTLLGNNYQDGNGTLTSDDLNYFLAPGVNYPEICVFKRDSVNAKFTKLYYINNSYINDPNFMFKAGPYFSISNNILAFGKEDSAGLVSEDVIYFAYNFREIEGIKVNNNITNYIKIFPNPINQLSIISYQLSERTFVNLSIYDITGREITNLVNEEKEKGEYTIKLNTLNFKSGVYFIKIQNGKEVSGVKFLKL